MMLCWQRSRLSSEPSESTVSSELPEFLAAPPVKPVAELVDIDAENFEFEDLELEVDEKAFKAKDDVYANLMAKLKNNVF